MALKNNDNLSQKKDNLKNDNSWLKHLILFIKGSF